MSDPATELAHVTRALAPDFVVEREIGRGGMGIVYLALDAKLGRQVAIKVLPDALAQVPETRARFLGEARTSAKLSHENIVRVYQADERDGVVFFVMAYIEGPSLAGRVAANGPLHADEIAWRLRDVALALDYAHAKGVVHRDITPENLLIDELTDRTIITDFGIARVAGSEGKTKTGGTWGTAAYMSPEHVLGGAIDGRSDLYSLGVVGFRLLTGRLPFVGLVDSAVMVANVHTASPKVRDLAPTVPPPLADVIDRCLEKSAEMRFADGAAMAAALEAAMPGVGHVAPTAAPPAPDVVSSREADAILERAAQLQDLSRAHETPSFGSPLAVRPPVAGSIAADDPADRRTLTSGYRFSDVQAAAGEVDIDAKYVERAAGDLGILARPSAERAVSAVVDQSPRASKFAGSPTAISYVIGVAAEPGPAEVEAMVRAIREQFGVEGHLSMVQNSITWSAGEGERDVRIEITRGDGQTTIRAHEDLAGLKRGIFDRILSIEGIVLAAGAVTVGPIVFGAYLVPFEVCGVLLVGGYWGARRTFRLMRDGRAKQLCALVEALAGRIARAVAH